MVPNLRARVLAWAALALILPFAICCTASDESGPDRTGNLTPAWEGAETVRLTIIYDNNVFDERLQTEWGFACWVEYGETNLLFDSGGDGSVLLSNMSILGFDPQDIDVVVLSHIHGDHTGGMEGLLATSVRPEVYVPVTFPTRYKNELRELVTVHDVDESQEILPGIHTTGKMGTNIPEQGLFLETSRGLVVITGCAHPGIDKMVRRTTEVGSGDIRLVVGGFHLGGASTAEVRGICAAFRELGVQQVAPCHCTGDQAMDIFADEFGDDYAPAGAGRVFDLVP